MDLRDLLLFLHIVGAAGWIGGGLFGVFGFGKLAAHGEEGGRAIETIVEKASVYFAIMAGLVVGAGVALVLTEDQFGWTDTFVLLGIGGIILSGVWQGLVASKKDTAMVEALKSDSSDKDAIVSSWRRTNWVDVAILLVVLWAMVVKF